MSKYEAFFRSLEKLLACLYFCVWKALTAELFISGTVRLSTSVWVLFPKPCLSHLCLELIQSVTLAHFETVFGF